MLEDIGITRADVNDAFSSPFWEDPTSLLRERAIERRMNRARVDAPRRDAGADRRKGFVVRVTRSGRRARRSDDITKRPTPLIGRRALTVIIPSRGKVTRPPAPPAGALFEFS